MIIHPVSLREDETQAVISSEIEYGGSAETLWYSVDRKFSQYLTTEKLDAFLLGLLPLAMKRGEDILIEGPISEKLYYNLTRHYMNIMNLVIPSFRPVDIIPGSLDDDGNHICENAVGTGFSGGIDSFCTIHDYFLSDVPPGYKITHLVFNNAGSHGEWDSQDAGLRFNARYDLIKGFAHEAGLEFIKIDSNLSDILMMNFQQTHVSRNVSCVLVLQKLFGKFLYSSGVRYQDSFIGKSSDQASADPASVHLLSTETLECISTGSQYSRIEKTSKVITIPGAVKWLNVCLFPDDPESPHNCSQCGKCLLTLFTLELFGVVDEYRDVFDLNIWKQQRRGFIINSILGKSRDPLLRELREYLKDTGYSFTTGQRLAGVILHLCPKRFTWVLIGYYRWIKWIGIRTWNSLTGKAGTNKESAHR